MLLRTDRGRLAEKSCPNSRRWRRFDSFIFAHTCHTHFAPGDKLYRVVVSTRFFFYRNVKTERDLRVRKIHEMRATPTKGSDEGHSDEDDGYYSTQHAQTRLGGGNSRLKNLDNFLYTKGGWGLTMYLTCSSQ